MELTTFSAGINGELVFDFFGSGYFNLIYVELYSELLDHTFQGAVVFDILNIGDTNRNGFSDFFEVSQAVLSIMSFGAYNISGFGNGGIIVTWSCDVGSV